MILLSLTKKPIFGVGLYVLLLFVSPGDRWWGGGFIQDVRWALVAGIVTILSMVLHGGSLNRSPFWSKGPVIAMSLFVVWLAIQWFWAINQEMHLDLLMTYLKYILAIWMLFRCIRGLDDAEIFLWCFFVGCFYFGWIAYSEYSGGRFDDFGGAGIATANFGALALVGGVLVGAGLFVAGGNKARVAVVGLMPLVMNGLIATVSRGAFLAFSAGGLLFNWLAPIASRKMIRIASLLGIVLLLLVTNESYWQRMLSIKTLGSSEAQSAELGMDVSDGGRKELLHAQFVMFKDYPMGCGHRCTGSISRYYLDDKYLSGEGDKRGRSSHNTVMTFCVEHGIVGIIFYILMSIWLIFRFFRLRIKTQLGGDKALVFQAVALTAMLSILVADLFSDYVRFEIRFWFIGFFLALDDLISKNVEGKLVENQ